jgi:hypothetical protein
LTKTIYIVVAPSGYWEHVCSSEQSAKEICWAEFESRGCKGYTVEKWNATKDDQDMIKQAAAAGIPVHIVNTSKENSDDH